MDNAWLAWRKPPPEQAAHRLFCLPYAGGGASAYRGWHSLAPASLQVCPVELPGRGRRLGETPFTRLQPLVGALADALRPHLDRPYALFGHSMGGLLAFELTRTLRRRRWPAPAHLFVSGAASPDAPRTRPPVHAAPDAEVKAELLALGGTPAELLDDDDLMDVMLPTMRADFSVLETYEYRPEPPLAVPMTVFGGTADPLVPPTALRDWRHQSTAGSRLRLLPGGHFFLHPAAADLLTDIAATLARTAHPAA